MIGAPARGIRPATGLRPPRRPPGPPHDRCAASLRLRGRDVAHVERLASTFVLGFAASRAGGRFSSDDPRAGRGSTAAPAHRRLTAWLAAPVDWDGEFETDLDDLVRLVESLAHIAR